MILPLLLLIWMRHAHGAPLLHPTILADTNRDGTVDNNDMAYKSIWSTTHGAIFLANIGDSSRRCPTFDLIGKPLSMFELAVCNDASGDQLLAPEFAAPLLTLPIEGLPETASGHIYVEPENAADRVRIFYDSGTKEKPEWQLVKKELRFNATTLGKGLTLAMDAREPIMDLSTWDGLANIVFDVYANDNDEVSRDMVAAKVAPVLIHHPLQQVQTVITTAGNDTTSPWQAKFVDDLQSALDSMAVLNEPLLLLNNSEDQWAQDFFEPGYTMMPGRNGPVVLRVNIRSVQPGRTAGSQVFSRLRGPGVGGIQLPGGLGRVEINSGGNIETIPPYTSTSGVHYPHGRIIMGKHFDQYPEQSMIDFLDAQGVQKPLILETGWLVIGHVDEMVQFLPSNSSLGFKVAVVDPPMGLDILRQAQASGHGGTRAGSYDGPTNIEPWAFTFAPWEPILGNHTIDDVLADANLVEANMYAQKFIDRNLEMLRQELGLNESDIVRIPTLYIDLTFQVPHTPDGLPDLLSPIVEGQKKLLPRFPEALNGIILPPHEYIAPKTWGPIVEGRDILEDAIMGAYSAAGMNVTFVDDLISYHIRGGQVHCATNTYRVVTG